MVDVQEGRLGAFEQRCEDVAINQRRHLPLGHLGVMPLGRFGEYGTWAGQLDQPHEVEFDSKGNMYTSEWSRVQKFIPVTPPAK